jgi:methylmalonyl-CoA/ethylmalonyl-CoA epimerase
VMQALARRGEGLHHIAFAVTDIREALGRLAAAGVALIDREPRPGARGHLVAFLHPRAMNGTLVELVQRHPQ